jgi:6-phosphogluconolactonase
MAHGEIIICKDPDSVAEKAAEFFVSCGRKAIGERGRFSVVLSGGSTPKLMFEKLAASLAEDLPPLPLDKIYFFFGDERMVPVTSEESNFRMANELLLKPLGIPETHFFRFRTELEPEAAAAEYSAAMRAHFGIESGLPSFDLVYLGLGTDGHTASLFPGTDVVDERDEIAAAVHVPKVDAHRLTLTFPALNAAAAVAFLVTGKDKRDVLQKVWEGDCGLPAERISPAGDLVWFVDKAAAGQP